MMLSPSLAKSAIALSLIALLPVQSVLAAVPSWTYDSGPDRSTAMGRELVELTAKIPYFPGVSQAVMGEQKFRPFYGPVPWRMNQAPNSVKILFIGQDATHVAEAANRPATAGFGGRAMDVAKYFGVTSGAAFINTYAFTIKGQYGSFGAPILRSQPGGGSSVSFGSVVETPLWMLSMDPASPLVQWRNNLIEWIIRNNRDSLKMIVTFGGAARDAAAVFVESRGGKVGTRTGLADLSKITIPEWDNEFAGGNNEAPVPLTTQGKDLYSELAGQSLDYTNPADFEAGQKALSAAMASDPKGTLEKMAISKGGIAGSGVVHPAQIGGFDMDNQLEINGKRTKSLKFLKLSDGTEIENDVLVVSLTHPSSLSKMTKEEAKEAVKDDLAGLKPYVDKGWKIEADEGEFNAFADHQEYNYGRGDIGPETYDFGTPASRMVNVSSAVRLTPSVIIFGTRERPKFDQDAIQAITDSKPAQYPGNDEIWTTRARSASTRFVWDAGPGASFAMIMKENLPKIDWVKIDDLWEDVGHLMSKSIDKKYSPEERAAFLAQAKKLTAEGRATHGVWWDQNVNRDFGHYRGTFQKPRVLIVADPDGYDDIVTSRALTGARGQYLHRLMEEMGVGDQYLVLKTVPFAIEDSMADWADMFNQTKSYREAIIQAAVKGQTPELIIADGRFAAEELERILGAGSFVAIERSGTGNASGIAEAAGSLSGGVLGAVSPSLEKADVPRSHLTFYARLWEGRGGDHVLTSTDPKFRGKAFAEVAPAWAYTQDYQMEKRDLDGVDALIKKIIQNKLRKGGESIESFFERIKGTAARLFPSIFGSNHAA